jgi:hypothetical protein
MLQNLLNELPNERETSKTIWIKFNRPLERKEMLNGIEIFWDTTHSETLRLVRDNQNDFFVHSIYFSLFNELSSEKGFLLPSCVSACSMNFGMLIIDWLYRRFLMYSKQNIKGKVPKDSSPEKGLLGFTSGFPRRFSRKFIHERNRSLSIGINSIKTIHNQNNKPRFSRLIETLHITVD